MIDLFHTFYYAFHSTIVEKFGDFDSIDLPYLGRERSNICRITFSKYLSILERSCFSIVSLSFTDDREKVDSGIFNSSLCWGTNGWSSDRSNFWSNESSSSSNWIEITSPSIGQIVKEMRRRRREKTAEWTISNCGSKVVEKFYLLNISRLILLDTLYKNDWDRDIEFPWQQRCEKSIIVFKNRRRKQIDRGNSRKNKTLCNWVICNWYFIEFLKHRNMEEKVLQMETERQR